MTDNDKARFAELVTGTAEALGRNLSKAGIRVFWNALREHSLPEVERAFDAHIRGERGQFMPTPADIIRQISGDPAERSMEAWRQVVDAMSRHGGGVTVMFSDPRVNAAIESMGGWPDLCASTEDRKWLERRFREHYDVANPERGKRVLRGRYDIENAARGFAEWVQPPVLLGDAEKARALLEAPKAEAAALLEGIG